SGMGMIVDILGVRGKQGLNCKLQIVNLKFEIYNFQFTMYFIPTPCLLGSAPEGMEIGNN
ncbi:MAG TPA: hypothetical protein ACFYD5_03850, partial [Candidatus Tripitaka sp. YC43]